MISETYAPDIVKVANDNGVEPAAMLAVVEVETSGSPLEKDGRTPRFLFERHVFYRELKKRAGQAKLREAISKGLAHQGRQKSQYKDQGSSAAKLALLERARVVDEECANRACSWGLGQVLGANAESLGFGNATEMVTHLMRGGVPAQLELMAAFIRENKLIGALNRHDWAGFARVYNGAGYARNRYDTKLANAYARWLGAVDRIVAREGPLLPMPQPGSLAFGMRGDSVTALQTKLDQLGYAVGEIDGIFGRDTRDAVSSFQTDRGLAPSGIADASTLGALETAAGRPPVVPGERLPVSDEALRSLLLLLLQRIASEGRVSGTAQGRPDPDQVLQTIIAELVKQRSAEATPSPGTVVPIASSTPPMLTWIDKLFPASEALAGKKTALSVIAGAALGVLQFTPLAMPATAAQILATLIGGAGGLGLLSKFDRGINLLGIIANKPSVLGEPGTHEPRPPDARYGGHLGDVPFWER